MKMSPLPPLLVLSLVLCPGAALGQRLLQPEDVANLAEVSEPRLSPDGSRVVYVQRIPREADEDRGSSYSMLWVVPAEGGEAIAFTPRVGLATRPRWSPGGDRIAFLDQRGEDDEGKRQIFVISLLGGEARQVSKAEENVAELEWSADGRAILYTSRAPKTEERKEAEKKGRDWEVADREYRQITLSRLDVESGETEWVSGEAWSFRQIASSPAGGRLTALATANPRVDDSYMFQQLVSVDVESGAVSPVWDPPGKALAPRFSPDGAWIALRAGVAAHDPYAGSVFLVSAEGGEARNLTPDYPGSVEWFEFDDHGGIVLVATHGTQTWVQRIDLESGEIETLSDSGPVFTAAHLGGEGALVVVASTPSHPREVLLRSSLVGEWTRLTHSYSHLEGIELGRQETVEWAARDGLRIEGVLVYPLDYEEGQRYPLVVGVHGGPESAIRNGWHTGHSYLSQLLAHRGTLFLLPNYRGSAGRGTGFLLADHGDPVGAEFQDVLDGIQDLVDRGIVDKERVGIMGGSYGGYFSAWGATKYTDWFRAAVVNYGVTNMFSDWGDGDIPWEHRLVHWGFFPADRPLLSMDRSPVTWVRGSRTPTLIMHGGADPRVPTGQSRELYQGMMLNVDLPVEFVVFPREGHGYREAPHRLEACRRALAWMVKHLELEDE